MLLPSSCFQRIDVRLPFVIGSLFVARPPGSHRTSRTCSGRQRRQPVCFWALLFICAFRAPFCRCYSGVDHLSKRVIFSFIFTPTTWFGRKNLALDSQIQILQSRFLFIRIPQKKCHLINRRASPRQRLIPLPRRDPRRHPRDTPRGVPPVPRRLLSVAISRFSFLPTPISPISPISSNRFSCISILFRDTHLLHYVYDFILMLTVIRKVDEIRDVH